MPHPPQMPIAPGANLKKFDGSEFTENDREYWELANRPFEHNGEMKISGIREHRHMAYPKMLFKARDERNDPRESFERQTAQSERHHQDIVAGDPAWKESKAEATAYRTAQVDDIARHAAEAAYKAESMSAPAKRQYRKRSAESTAHAQE